ncbi:hypothetical protein BTHERMOSOX_13 [Bathymodiolus thermophilus thioautotrophic gill symbiont]|uniref:Uncharacterized protein n=1 Tax=Bathymodiolus thermophilus thioautotrophic gill symbiont TaxID=2360 RepID=A0A8H9CFM0_9GAMM|nr:hypothetical protein [Bathymodiolus thermophilus thioautotrophic gill symbiont]CAB5499812.1 hypothetical protein THERMOS_1092 [Bathymodiolus thermophilus thioautotrophic gill symbiont]CAB5501679.1 hypothetical protein THERMOT_1469 [Bathymodiolus thermophilus thioautotrophic gill symbiont]SGZ66417.1 hypothetical protein BTHERMOSOX_13 [Bathymodiolus thermophilus thioautotrophic gill symbiont]
MLGEFVQGVIVCQCKAPMWLPLVSKSVVGCGVSVVWVDNNGLGVAIGLA